MDNRFDVIVVGGKRNGITVTGPKRITKTGMYNYCWPGCLTVMYDRDVVGLIQIADIKKNNDYAMWLKVCQRADCPGDRCAWRLLRIGDGRRNASVQDAQ